MIADCRNGREPTQATPPAVPPGQKKPVPGSTGANPPALDGTGTQPRRRQRRRHRDRQRPAAGARRGGRSRRLPGGGRRRAAGSARARRRPEEGRGALPGGVPPAECPGATPGGAGGQQVPPQGQQQAAAAGRRQLSSRRMAAAPRTSGCREALLELDAITRRLRRECPWDREQDERSIVPHTVEEAYELADAAHSGDDAKLLDELGDVLFQVYFLVAAARGARRTATSPRSRRRAREKLVRRHPHIFGERRRWPSCPPTPRHAVRGEAELGRDQAARGPRRASVAGGAARRSPTRASACKREPPRATATRRPRSSASRARARPSRRTPHHGSDELYDGGRRAAARRSSSWPPTLRVDPEIALRRRRSPA